MGVGTFKVSFSQLAIGEAGKVTISVTTPPRSDVVLTLVGNNLNFDPPYVTFTHSVTQQSITVNVVHADFKDSDNIPFAVDYILSGSNWQDYIPPAQTYVGVRQGGAPIVGAICGSAASVLGVSFLWLVAALLLLL